MSSFWGTVREILALIGTATISYFTGRVEAEKAQRIKELESALEGAKRLNEVPENTERDAALERLRKTGKLRE